MGKSHTELEQPAKVYQLEALDAKLETIGGQLKTIVNQTAGLATLAQLEAVKIDYKEKIEELRKDTDAIYGPPLKKTAWLYTTVIAEGIALLGAAIWVIILRN